jgi:hypothetical protein
VLYVNALKKIFAEFADKYAPERSGELEIVQ